MSLLDIGAVTLFALLWIFYEPLLRGLSGPTGALNHDMVAIRAAWMRKLLARDVRISDANLVGHVLSSATFFASTNILIVAAAVGALLNGEGLTNGLAGIAIFAPSPLWLLEIKFGLLIVTLVRGLLNFIWAIRQFNYCVALIGAAPDPGEPSALGFADAMSEVLTPALSAFNAGVRGYYFALAAVAWLVGPLAMAIAAVAAFALLVRRQLSSKAARGIRMARQILEER